MVYFPKFREITALRDITSGNVEVPLKLVFARHAILYAFVSVIGPHYATAEFNTTSTTLGTPEGAFQVCRQLREQHVRQKLYYDRQT